MKSFLLLAGLITGLAIASSEDAAVQKESFTPGQAGVQKVIQMLQDMAAKGKEEKKKEEIAYAEFQTWCETESAQLKNNIAQAAEAIDLLTAQIDKLTTEAKVLGEEIAKLQSDVASYEAEKEAKTKSREKEHKAYLLAAADYGESLDALDRAIAVVSKVSGDIPADADAAVLLQLAKGDKLPAQAKSMVAAFLGMMGSDFLKSMAPDEMGYNAPEANLYEFQSGGIIAMLKRLRDEFRGKLADTQKEEMNAAHAYAMIITDLKDSIENANESISEKTATKARKEEEAAAAKKSLAATITQKKEDEETLKSMLTECEEKKLSYTEKQQLRTEEIEAINQAIKILQADPSEVADKYTDLAQTGKTNVALAQLRSSGQSEGIQGHLRDFIASEGRRLHSRNLALLAQKIAADPFGKVKKMIDDMITRLLEEANMDANHEGYCDEEMGKSKITRNKLNEDIDALTAAVEEGKATILRLTDEIALLTKEVADLDVSMGQATKIRKDEKAANKQTVEDAESAQAAVAAATAVLKKFYEKASLATGLLQLEVSRPKMGSEEWKALANPNYEGTGDQGLKISGAGASWGHTEGMQTFGKKYTGQQDQAGGVLAMLEVIMSDFANLEADTKANEASSQEAYENFMADSKKNKATKLKSIEMDEADKSAAEVKLQDDTKDLKLTQDELLSADRYYEKLVPQCIDKGMTYEERVEARESEIASLKQALQILR
jgi:hypothetical protein